MKLCLPNSGVLSKNETKQVKVLRDNNVTYLKLLAAVETTNKTLTSSQKEYDDKFSAFDNPRDQEASVEEIENKGCNNNDQENIDEDEEF